MPDPGDVTGDPVVIAFRLGQPTPEELAQDVADARKIMADLEGIESADQQTDPYKGLCDLCGRSGILAWLYPCDSFMLPELRYTSTTDWAACDPCSALVEADDMAALFARRMSNPEPEAEAMIAELEPSRREQAQRARELFVRTMHEAFMVHRWGERRPFDPAEGYDMPEAIRALPRDERGLPIPFAQLRVDGRPDFRSLDQALVAKCVKDRLCGICGRPLDYWIAFMGGPACQKNRLFKDPAMHPECAAYAAKTCPFIAGSQTKYSSRPLPEGPDVRVHVDRNMADHERRPVDMFIFTTRRYKLVQQHGETYIEATPWASVQRIEPLR